MIAGPGVFICNECTLLAVEILETEMDGFENKTRAMEIYQDLCSVEKLNIESFKHIGAYIKGVLHALQAIPPGQKNQSDTE